MLNAILKLKLLSNRITLIKKINFSLQALRSENLKNSSHCDCNFKPFQACFKSKILFHIIYKVSPQKKCELLLVIEAVIHTFFGTPCMYIDISIIWHNYDLSPNFKIMNQPQNDRFYTHLNQSVPSMTHLMFLSTENFFLCPRI